VTALALQQATIIVEAALRKARETGCAPLAVAVLDAGGHLKAFAREDGAGIVRPQIAIGKAWGALGMGVGTRALARRVAEQPQLQPFFASAGPSSGRSGSLETRRTRTRPAPWRGSKRRSSPATAADAQGTAPRRRTPWDC